MRREKEMNTQFISHRPSYPLGKHLLEVSGLSYRFAEKTGVEGKIIEVARYIGALHDVGKYTTFFQRYIRRKRSRYRGRHSLVSAVIAYEASKIYGPLEDMGMAERLAYIFVPIASHHTSLDSPHVNQYVIDNNETMLSDQLNDLFLNKEKIFEDLRNYGLDWLITPLDKTFSRLKDPSTYIEGLRDELIEVNLDISEKIEHLSSEGMAGTLEYYLKSKLLFSILIDADKRAASGLMESHENTTHLMSTHIESFITRFPVEGINCDRRRLFEVLMKRLCRLSPHEYDVYVVNAPTGAGKTLMGIYTALWIRERLDGDGLRRPVIYALPLINIVEQTYEVVKKIYSEVLGVDHPEPGQLLKYHHLSMVGHFESRDDERPVDELLLSVDSWESDFIVTTFNQVIEAFVKPQNSLNKKLHNMVPSIIIIDEVQALPTEYWLLLRRLIEETTRVYGIKYVLMSATIPPWIVKSGDFRWVELLTNERIINRMGWGYNRWRLVDQSQADMDTDGLVDIACEMVDRYGSLLIVVNTIPRSKEVYQRLRKKLCAKYKVVKYHTGKQLWCRDKGATIILSYLSTNVVPKERIARIERLKHLISEGWRVVLVSTQAVEAGVDIDFEAGIRDVAPIDSIIQVAGRCNRNARGDPAPLHLVRLCRQSVDDAEEGGSSEKRCDARIIYGVVSDEITRESLEELRRELRDDITERDMLLRIGRIFDKVVRNKAVETSDASKNVLKKMAMISPRDNEVKNFSLLEEGYKAVDIYVELDDEAVRLREEYNDLVNQYRDLLRRFSEGRAELKDVINMRRRLRLKWAEMSRYIASDIPSRVYIGDYEEWGDAGLYVVRSEDVGHFYDLVTGIVHRDGEGTVID